MIRGAIYTKTTQTRGAPHKPAARSWYIARSAYIHRYIILYHNVLKCQISEQKLIFNVLFEVKSRKIATFFQFFLKMYLTMYIKRVTL